MVIVSADSRSLILVYKNLRLFTGGEYVIKGKEFKKMFNTTTKMFSKILICFFVVAMAAAFMHVAEAQEFVTDGLVAFYTLDEADIDGDTVKDMSGNGNDATIKDTLECVEGVIDECLKFDRDGNYVEIPPLGQWEQGSIECWAYTNNLGHDYQGIVSTWQWVAGKVHFKFQDNQIQVDKNGGTKITSSAEAETWYHIIYTCDTKANELKLYVDGELVAEGVAGAEPQNMDERRIGSEHDGRFLDGMVDEVRIYDRILNEDEVMQNFRVSSNELAVDAAGKFAMTWASIKSER